MSIYSVSKYVGNNKQIIMYISANTVIEVAEYVYQNFNLRSQYYINKLKIEDASNIKIKNIAHVELLPNYNNLVETKLISEVKKQKEEQEKTQKALDKLTDEEKELIKKYFKN